MIERYSRPEMAQVWSEHNKLARWLEVELAAVDAWAEAGVVPREDAQRIRAGATFDEQKVAEYLRITHHDVTAFLRSVADHLGPEGRWVHLGLTSSDVWDTATSLQLLQATDILLRDLDALERAVTARALEHRATLCVGRTHGIHAEPMSFGLKLALWVDEIRRARARLLQAREEVAYGKISGAVGTHATVPPQVEERTCAVLGLRPAPVTNQILQRDRHARYVTTLALIAASLEKFATEIRHLQRTEVREVEEPFSEGQTGSSAMPHKRNPEKCERVCGIARTVRGYAVTALENVALWHERDISHSSAERIILPDACGLLDYALDLFTGIVRGMRVFPHRMRANLDSSYGLVFSQRVLLTLVERGLDRQHAYGIVQRNAMRAWDTGTPLRTLLEQDAEAVQVLAPADLNTIFDPEWYLRYTDAAYRRLGLLADAAP